MILEKNKVALWTSSSPSSKIEFAKGIKQLQALGKDVTVPKLVKSNACKAESKSRAFLAGKDESKIETLEEIWGIRDCKTILATRGGYGAIRLLPLLDKLRSLKSPNKVLWGYSDLTIIQNYLHSRNGGAWVHSPMLSSKSFYAPTPKEARAWKDFASNESKDNTVQYQPKILNLSSKHRGKTLMRGLVLGGNLASLISMMGTPWEFNIPKQSWLFIEEVQEGAYKLDRLLTQLSYHKDFKNLEGVIMGHFTKCDGYKKILELWSAETDKTLLHKLQSGHEAPNIPITLGDNAHFERKNENTYFLTLPKPAFGC